MNSLIQTFHRSVETHGERFAITEGERSYTYAELADTAGTLGRHLDSVLQPGDRLERLDAEGEIHVGGSGVAQGAWVNRSSPWRVQVVQRRTHLPQRGLGSCAGRPREPLPTGGVGTAR